MRPFFESVFCRCLPFSGFALAVAILFLASAVPPVFPQNNAVTLPRNLSQLVSEADSIVQGRVTSVSLEPHPQLRNLLMVVVTVQLEDTLLGQSTGIYTFSQAVIDKRDQQQKMGYRVGQHLLLVMMRPSVYGLTSPAGMQQGRFEIVPGADGKLHAVNGFGNLGLFRGMDSQLKSLRAQVSQKTVEQFDGQKSGPLRLEDLKTVIRSAAPRKLPQ